MPADPRGSAMSRLADGRAAAFSRVNGRRSGRARNLAVSTASRSSSVADCAGFGQAVGVEQAGLGGLVDEVADGAGLGRPRDSHVAGTGRVGQAAQLDLLHGDYRRPRVAADTTMGWLDQAVRRCGAISSWPWAQTARPMKPVRAKSSARPGRLSR